MPAGMVAEPPPHPTPLVWLASGLITLEAAAALALVTGMLLSGLPAVSCGGGFWWGLVGAVFLWSLAWPAAGVGLLVGVKLLALRGWALFLALGIEGALLFGAIRYTTVPVSLRFVVGSVAVAILALLAASMRRFRDGPPPTPDQAHRTEQFAAAAATSEAVLLERPQRRWRRAAGGAGEGAGALGCAILLLMLWEALGIGLLSNRQVRTLMLIAVAFGALGNLTLGTAAPPSLSDGLPNRLTQVDMLVHPETRLYYPDADPLSSVVTADGCSSDGTATTHLLSHAAFPTIYKWYKSWLVEEHWEASPYTTSSLDYVGPGVEYIFDRGKRETFTLTIDSPPATDAVPGATYFEASYQIKGG